MSLLVGLLFTAVCIELSTAICSDIPSGLYCINLINNTNNKILISQNETDSQKNDVQVIYLRNSSGEIDQYTFSNFSMVKILDIQFSSIDNFSIKATPVDILYLMYNFKFPALSADFMKKCCQNMKMLYIVENNRLEIEEGAFKHMKDLTHLTISKQNITNLSRDFFEGLEKLAYLNLKENGILEIDESTFENLTELNHLILSYNNFTKLKPKTFQNLKVLEVIELQGLNFSDFNITIFNNQKELKVLELPTELIKEKLELNEIIKIFAKLETFGFQNENKDDSDVAKFISKCKASGFNIIFSNRFDL